MPENETRFHIADAIEAVGDMVAALELGDESEAEPKEQHNCFAVLVVPHDQDKFQRHKLVHW